MHKAALTPNQRRLVGMMQSLNYGSIRRLVIRAGQPVFVPPPHSFREVKFCGSNGPRPEVAQADFSLKAAVCDLFAQLEALGNGVVICLHVQRGLPFRMTVEEKYA